MRIKCIDFVLHFVTRSYLVLFIMCEVNEAMELRTNLISWDELKFNFKDYNFIEDHKCMHCGLAGFVGFIIDFL
jgi:hypothetical protein